MPAKKSAESSSPPPKKKAAKSAVVKSVNAKSPDSLDDLAANPNNPRKKWASDKERQKFLQSLQTFGDLSGIVFNRTTGQIVGGHKRVDEFKAGHSELKITEKLSAPDKVGTVAYGHVIMPDGTRFAYREVAWPSSKESAANLAANRWGAEWELGSVKDLLIDAKAGGFDLDITGFDFKEVESLMGDLPTSTPKPGANAGQGGGTDSSTYVRRYEVVITCENEAAMKKVYEDLTEEGYPCRALII